MGDTPTNISTTVIATQFLAEGVQGWEEIVGPVMRIILIQPYLLNPRYISPGGRWGMCKCLTLAAQPHPKLKCFLHLWLVHYSCICDLNLPLNGHTIFYHAAGIWVKWKNYKVMMEPAVLCCTLHLKNGLLLCVKGGCQCYSRPGAPHLLPEECGRHLAEAEKYLDQV